jgi:predicted phage tail protein
MNWCPNELGSYEPRFTCNLYLRNQEAGVQGRAGHRLDLQGMAYWSGGAITVTQDAPARRGLSIHCAANVIDGDFSYQGSSAKARHTGGVGELD